MTGTPKFLVRGQTGLQVTERASYRLTPQGLELLQVAVAQTCSVTCRARWALRQVWR